MSLVFAEKALRVPCQEVTDPLGAGLQVADRLQAALIKYNGIGLAANQLGFNERVCIVSTPREEDDTTYHVTTVFINPVVTHRKGPILFEGEGCLSFPDKIVETVRYAEVEVKDALQPEGRLLRGLDAVVALHEIDHLFGITMFDRRVKTIGPNGRCPCESGRKFKKCCLPHLKKWDATSNP